MYAIELRVLPIGELTPAQYNPRRAVRPTDSVYLKLKRSLTEFGLVEPLIWNERTNRVVGGHLRLSILKELGHTAVTVSVVKLSEAKEKALNVVLNNREAQGQFDPRKLAEVLEQLVGEPEFDDTGFDPSVMNHLEFQPAEDLPPDLHDPNRVELTLVMNAEQYDAAQAQIDTLVREFDLESHLRRG
jgi:hypothetical protein